MENSKICQSYQLTTARQDYNLTSQRAMLYIVKKAQACIEGQHLNEDLFDKVGTDLFENKYITLQLKDLVPEGEQVQYNRIKQDLKELFKITAEWKYQDRIVMRPFVQSIELNFKGYAVFEVHKETWQLILDYSKGYRRFELEKAMQCRSIYSLRLYELISEKTEPITYKIETLKKMFKLENKYSLTKDFINRVIIPAKKELDKTAPYSFDFQLVKESTGKGRPKISAITFIPKYQPQNEDSDIAEAERMRKHTGAVLERDTARILQDNFGFTPKELENNINLILDAQLKFNVPDFLRKIFRKAKTAENPKGYIINALKMEIAQS